ncbi:hypothetical protein BDV98DRAFT_479960, partial [Pterulicium gracile]
PLTIPPPIQELSSPSPTPSSDSDGCTAKLTISALRKILDEQPPASTSTLSASKLKAPQFMPGGRKNERGMSGFSEPRVSTATASVSRLLTKGTHSMTTRPPSPPKSSVLKKRDGNGTPISITGSNASLSFSSPIQGTSHSNPGSGASTPKRISFAEPPEGTANPR